MAHFRIDDSSGFYTFEGTALRSRCYFQRISLQNWLLSASAWSCWKRKAECSNDALGPQNTPASVAWNHPARAMRRPIQMRWPVRGMQARSLKLFEVFAVPPRLGSGRANAMPQVVPAWCLGELTLLFTEWGPIGSVMRRVLHVQSPFVARRFHGWCWSPIWVGAKGVWLRCHTTGVAVSVKCPVSWK